MHIPLLKYVTWYLIVALFIIGIAPRLDAGMAPSELVAAASLDRAADLASVQRVLEMKVVRDRLEKIGFSSEEVRAKLDRLNDQQLHQLALKIDDLRVGQDSAVGIIIALLVIVILVIIIIQLSGRKIIITK